MFRKKVIKRTLELVGAVAMVYIMLEILEAQTGKNEMQLRTVDQPRIVEDTRRNPKIPMPRENVVRESYIKEPAPPVNFHPKVQANPPAIEVQQPPPQPKVVAKPAVPAAPKVEEKKPAPKKEPAPAVAAGIKPKYPKSLDLKPEPKLKSTGYLLPMLYFDMGPNNLFRLLRQGVVSAYEMGRTAVVPVFHRHPRMGDEAQNPFVLPIFDTNYTVDLVWPPTDTIDTGMLKKFIPVVGQRDFNIACKNKIDAVIKCGIMDQKRLDGIKYFKKAANIKALKEIEIKTYEELVPNDMSEGIVGIDDYKCLGLIYGKKCLPDQDRWLAEFSRIAPYYKRPLPTRTFAKEFIAEIMGSKPFMAVHWRYESDWLDMCKDTRPKGAIERNKEICKMVTGLEDDENLRKKFIQNLKNKMKDYSLEVVYLASPPNNVELIKLMKDSFPGNCFTEADVLEYAEKKRPEGFLGNNYKASFVEQEICFSAALSSWTQTVLTDRLAVGIKRHDSVLNVVSNNGPGFPELLFQFPEGNFNFGGMIGKKKN